MTTKKVAKKKVVKKSKGFLTGVSDFTKSIAKSVSKK